MERYRKADFKRATLDCFGRVVALHEYPLHANVTVVLREFLAPAFLGLTEASVLRDLVELTSTIRRDVFGTLELVAFARSVFTLTSLGQSVLQKEHRGIAVFFLYNKYSK